MSHHAAVGTRRGSQLRILTLSWFAYALCYLLRVNIAVVIPALVNERGYSLTQMGLVTSVYFFVYMTGQLINGYLGDRFSGKGLIVGGLILSALCNLSVAAADHFVLILISWGINGLAQSMLWGPLMKTLSVWFYGHQLERVSFIMSLTAVVGYAVSWGASTILVSRLGWQSAFYLPAILVLIYALVLIVLFRNRPTDIDIPAIQQVEETQSTGSEREYIPIRSFFRSIQLPKLLFIALMLGLIREGISVWFPTILQQSAHLPVKSPLLILIVIPIINFGGILLIRCFCRKLNGDSSRTLLLTFVLITAAALLLNVFSGYEIWLILGIMVALLSLASGLTPILTSFIPFQFARFNRVAITAGAIDFAIYFGAALSGILSGIVADHFAWSGVMVIWLVAAVIGLSLSLIRYQTGKRMQKLEQNIHQHDPVREMPK